MSAALSSGLDRVRLGTLVWFQTTSDVKCGISSLRISLRGKLSTETSSRGQFFLGGRGHKSNFVHKIPVCNIRAYILIRMRC